MLIFRSVAMVVMLAACSAETVYLSRFWGFCLLAGISVLLLLTWLVNLKDKRVYRNYLIATLAFGLAAGLCFPGWAMKSPEMAKLLEQIQRLRSLTAMAGQGALRTASSERVDRIVIDCKKLKKETSITSYTQLKEAPDLSACLRKLAQFRTQNQSSQRSQKGMAQAVALLNAAEKTIQKCKRLRRPLSASEAQDVQEQIAAAEVLIKGERTHLPKSEHDRLIRKLFNSL